MKILMILALFCLTVSANAVERDEVATIEAIDTQIDCINGGNIVIIGQYKPVSGDFDIQATAIDCSNTNNIVSNGTATATGTFKKSSDTQADLDAEINIDVTRQSDGSLTTKKCKRTLSGSYNMTTEQLEGSSNKTCDSSGSLYLPVMKIVSGFEEL